MQIRGKIVAIMPLENGTSQSGREWVKSGLVIEHEGGQYPKRCVMTTMREVVAKYIQTLKVGQEVDCHINIDGREWNGKWFSDIQVWKIDAVSDQPSADPPSPPTADIQEKPF